MKHKSREKSGETKVNTVLFWFNFQLVLTQLTRSKKKNKVIAVKWEDVGRRLGKIEETGLLFNSVCRWFRCRREKKNDAEEGGSIAAMQKRKGSK